MESDMARVIDGFHTRPPNATLRLALPCDVWATHSPPRPSSPSLPSRAMAASSPASAVAVTTTLEIPAASSSSSSSSPVPPPPLLSMDSSAPPGASSSSLPTDADDATPIQHPLAAFVAPRPSSAMSSTNSLASSVRERRVVSHLHVHIPPSPAPFLGSSTSLLPDASTVHIVPVHDDALVTVQSPLRSPHPRRTTSTVDLARSTASMMSLGRGLGFGASRVRSSSSSADDADSDDFDAPASRAILGSSSSNRRSSREDEDDHMNGDNDHVLFSARQLSPRRDWGDEELDGPLVTEEFPAESLSPLSPRNTLSDSNFAGARKSSIAGSVSTTLGATEEWRAKILDGVRKGEERVAAQKRKESHASVNTFHAPPPPTVPLAPPLSPTSILPETVESSAKTESPVATSSLGQSHVDTVTNPPTLNNPSSPSSSDSAFGAYADAIESPVAQVTILDAQRSESPAPSFRSVEVTGSDIRLHERASSDNFARSSASEGPTLGHDARRQGATPTAMSETSPTSSRDESGTYISVADPSHLTMMGGTQRDFVASVSPHPGRPKSSRKNFFSTLLHRAQNPSLGSPPSSHSRSSSSPSLGADAAFFGRGFRSQPGTPAAQHRSRLGGGINGSTSAGGLSALTASRQTLGLGIEEATLSPPTNVVIESSSSNPMGQTTTSSDSLSRQSTIGPRNTASAAGTPNSTPRITQSTTTTPSGPNHQSGLPFLRSTLSLNKVRGSPHQSTSNRPSLDSLGLKVVPLTPTLSMSKYAQPLCGAVLDEKYLLIGTTNGLDFLPLQHVVTDKTGGISSLGANLKPISLIKKTKFKSLQVLEVRSNILLAIAGRNNHLRVYALDGLRAIITKKMAELTTKDEFVFIPTSLSRSLHSLADPKGKAKAAESPRSLPAYTNSARSPPANPVPTPSATPAIGPHSPPPPYAQPLPVVHGCETSFTTAEPGLSTSAPLKRSNTVGQPSQSRRKPNLGVHRSSSTGNVATSPVTTDSSANKLEVENPLSSTQQPSQANELALIFDGEDKVESTSHVDSKAGSSTTIHVEPKSRGGDDDVEILAPQDDTQLANDNGSIQPIVMTPSASASSLKSPSSINRRRLVPRSPIAQQQESDTDNDLKHSDREEDREASLRQKRQKRGLSLADVLAEGPPSPLSNLSSTGMSRHPSIPPPSGSPAIWRPEPRPPVFRTSPKEFEVDANTDDPTIPQQSQHRRASLAEILAEGPPRSMTEPRRSSTTPPVATNSTLDASRRNTTASDSDGSPDLSRRGKRWSLIDSVFRAGVNTNTLSQDGPTFTAPPSPAHRNSTEGVDSPEDRLASQSRTLASPDASQDMNGTNTNHQRETSEPDRLSDNQTSPQPNGLRSRASTQKLRSTAGRDREELNESRLGSEMTLEINKAAPHPATVGAPLEYVKLARTKGARLLRAVETKKRTYLAVLCGDNGERVELFTGSKNISLSLNRTFILPETPRTIEFQIQGDDLVDIYLVYDESVFALEPATVRVREVGIGRNERRTARRERERFARDAVSQDQPGSFANISGANSPPPPTTPHLAQQTTTNELETTPVDTTAVEQDDGLSLAPPVNLTSRGNNASNGEGAEGSSSGPSGDNPPTTDGSATAWPYTTFQQLSFIPPLPASVLGSSFIIPPTYDAVVSAQNTPALPNVMRMGTLDELSDPAINVQLQANSSSWPTDEATTPWQSPNPQDFNMPLLSPISLLVNPTSRSIGPPGLFFVTRGKKITSIVDCDGRSVLKRPFLWQSKSSQAEDSNLGMKRIDVIVIEKKKMLLVGIHASGIKVAEVCARTATPNSNSSSSGSSGSSSQDEWSNGISVNVPPGTMKMNQSSSREVVWLGSTKKRNEVIWADRVGNAFGIFTLTPTTV